MHSHSLDNLVVNYGKNIAALLYPNHIMVCCSVVFSTYTPACSQCLLRQYTFIVVSNRVSTQLHPYLLFKEFLNNNLWLPQRGYLFICSYRLQFRDTKRTYLSFLLTTQHIASLYYSIIKILIHPFLLELTRVH